MKSTHEEGDICMQQIVLVAALENQNRILSTIDVTDVFYCFVFSIRKTCP